MPASAGRVRMPHNNRMSTSGALKTSSIWQKTIGHDPHAEQHGSAEPTEAERAAATARAENVMLVARQQNLTGDSNTRDDFALKLYTGLKGGKKGRKDGDGTDVADAERQRELQQLLEQDESSSEEEYQIVVEAAKKEKKNESSSRKESKRKEKKKKKHKSRTKSSSQRRDSDDDDSSDESVDSEDERRRRKRRKDKKKRKHRKRSHSSDESERSDDDDSSSRDRYRRKKHKKSSRSQKDEPPIDRFIAAEQYGGSKQGYVFKSGDEGVGYYEDTGKKIFASKLSPSTAR